MNPSSERAHTLLPRVWPPGVSPQLRGGGALTRCRDLPLKQLSAAARTASGPNLKLLYNLRASPRPPYTNLVNYALADLDADVRALAHSSYWTSCSLLLNLSFTLRDCLFSWTLFALGASCIQYARRNLIYRRNKSREASQSAWPGCLYHDALPTISEPTVQLRPVSFFLHLLLSGDWDSQAARQLPTGGCTCVSACLFWAEHLR